MTDTISETHKPRILYDGITHRATCTCGWSGDWTQFRGLAELQWGEHGVKTIQKNYNKRSFAIVKNPLAKGEQN